MDRKRIALVGFSLGACLALSVAAQDTAPIAAVVDWFGKLPAELRQRCKRPPPTLIVHGDADKTVPVREAEAIESLLKENQLAYEIKIYTKQEHLFKTEPFGADACDARKRTLAFLAKHLKVEVVAAEHKSGRQAASSSVAARAEK